MHHKPKHPHPRIGWSFNINREQLRQLGPRALSFRMVRDSGKWRIAPVPDRGYIVLLKDVTVENLESLPQQFDVKITQVDHNIGFAELT